MLLEVLSIICGLILVWFSLKKDPIRFKKVYPGTILSMNQQSGDIIVQYSTGKETLQKKLNSEHARTVMSVLGMEPREGMEVNVSLDKDQEILLILPPDDKEKGKTQVGGVVVGLIMILYGVIKLMITFL